MSSSIHFHICAATTVGIAHGTSMTARITPRPLKLELTTSAMVSPSTNSKLTVITVNLTVVQTESRKIVSCQRSLVVLEADPARRLEREELLVREALVDGLAERVDRDERDDRERRHEQQPGEPRLPALELRRLRRRRGRAVLGWRRRHR